MSIHNNTNINIQANHSDNSGIQGLEPQARNEALGNVHSSKLAIVGRIALGILTFGISEGIRAIVRHFSARPAASPRIDVPPQGQLGVQPNAPTVNRSKSKFDFSAMEAKLGRPMKAEELNAFSQIEQGLLKEKDGKTRVKAFQEKLMQNLDAIEELSKNFENRVTRTACQDLLMAHPELINEKNIKKDFFTLALYGTFDLMRNMDLATTPAKNIAAMLQHVAIGVRYVGLESLKDPALKQAGFKLSVHAQIEIWHAGSKFRALSNEKFEEIATEISNLSENVRCKAETELVVQMLRELRNAETQALDA